MLKPGSILSWRPAGRETRELRAKNRVLREALTKLEAENEAHWLALQNACARLLNPKDDPASVVLDRAFASVWYVDPKPFDLPEEAGAWAAPPPKAYDWHAHDDQTIN